MGRHIQRTDIYGSFKRMPCAGVISLFQEQVGQLQTRSVPGFRIRQKLLERIDGGLPIPFLQVRIGKRLICIVLVRVLGIHLDGAVQNLDGLVHVALRQRFLALAHKFGECLHFNTLHPVIHPGEELLVEVVEA